MIHARKHTSLRLSISDVNLVATFCSLPTSDTNLIIVSLLALLSNSVLFNVSFSVTILPFSKAFSCTRSVICNFEKHNDKLITRHLFHLNLKKSRGHNSLIFLEIKPTFLIISSTVNVALDISSTEMILDNWEMTSVYFFSTVWWLISALSRSSRCFLRNKSTNEQNITKTWKIVNILFLTHILSILFNLSLFHNELQ